MSNKTTGIQDASAEAWNRIAEEGFKPSPSQYELWYRYYDSDPDVCNAIDRHEGKITEATCHEIYERFVARSSIDNAMQKINDHLQEALTEISGAVGDMKDATTECGDSLADMSTQVRKADSIEDIESVISYLVNDTKKMIEYNRSLEQRLDTSSAQVNILKESLDVVRHEAMTDALTGLANRKSFNVALENAMREAEEDKEPLTLLMLDVDHFKLFNDSFGHLIGDQVLRLVARCLIDGVKGRDTSARYGGEEFAIILPNTPLSSGIVVANALRASVESREVINRTSNQHLGKITMSIGVAEYDKGESSDDFVERADGALYTAKNNGRNQVAAAGA